VSDIAKIDKAFRVETKIEKEGIVFYSADADCFCLYGVYRDGVRYRRLPEDVAKATSESVHSLHAHTAGGRLRFVTDSPYIAISAKMSNVGKMPHFPLTGSAGFDLYERRDGEYIYLRTFIPPYSITDGYESLIELAAFDGKREFLIHFPLYSNVDELYIGLDKDASVEKAPEYRYPVPVVYYGSSITQGGCASRPGCSYQAIISTTLDCDHINLGFSGSAKGEDAIAEYIAGLKMSVFVYDYDHNAPTPEHLEATHEKMFQTIRKAQPELPIVILSKPRKRLGEVDEHRKEIIYRTYLNAKAAGDENVYFIAGSDLIEDAMSESYTVDDCHPSDLGFFSMALHIGAQVRRLLK